MTDFPTPFIFIFSECNFTLLSLSGGFFVSLKLVDKGVMTFLAKFSPELKNKLLEGFLPLKSRKEDKFVYQHKVFQS